LKLFSGINKLISDFSKYFNLFLLFLLIFIIFYLVYYFLENPENPKSYCVLGPDGEQGWAGPFPIFEKFPKKKRGPGFTGPAGWALGPVAGRAT